MGMVDSPLERGLRELLATQGSGFERRHVARVDPHREGHLVFQVERNGQREWYAYREPSIQPMRVGEDAILPAAAPIAFLMGDGRGWLIAWQPGRRLTIRAVFGEDRRIIKSYRKRRSGDAAHRHRLAAKAAARSGLTVPALLDHGVNEEVIHLEVVEGLHPKLDSTATDLFSTLGRGLRVFQEAVEPDSLPVHGRGEELAVLRRLATRSLRLRNALPAGWETLVDTLQDHATGASREHLVLAHRDLHDGQLLVEKGRITLLDFDLLCIAESSLDAANLSAHFQLRSIQGLRGATRQSASDLSLALLDGLGRTEEDAFLDGFDFFRASTFLRLALVYFLRPRWESLAPALVNLADRYVHALSTA